MERGCLPWLRIQWVVSLRVRDSGKGQTISNWGKKKFISRKDGESLEFSPRGLSRAQPLSLFKREIDSILEIIETKGHGGRGEKWCWDWKSSMILKNEGADLDQMGNLLLLFLLFYDFSSIFHPWPSPEIFHKFENMATKILWSTITTGILYIITCIS